MAERVQVPSGWDNTAHERWLVGETHEAIQATLRALNSHAGPKPRRLLLQFSYYLFLIDDYNSVCDVLKEGLKSYPDDIEILRNLAVALGRAGHYQEAIARGERVVALEPGNYLAWDTLAANYYRTGQLDKASESGTRSLILKDATHGAPDESWRLPSGSVADYVGSRKRVIAFSLWGNDTRYYFGALRNLILAADIYRDWELWFFVDDSVPEGFLKQIEALGGVIKTQANGQALRQKLSWRFSVANDPAVGYFLIRDVDSVISVREYGAVQEWLESGNWFHIIRDWWTHTDLILAGLWGGVTGVLPDMSGMMDRYQSDNEETPNIDQWFLRDCVWRLIKPGCLVHDRCFHHNGSVPLPGPLPSGNFHVGCDESAQRADFQSKILSPWIREADWMRELETRN